jgi:hypothetical protein
MTEEQRMLNLAWTQRLVNMPSLRREIGRVVFGIKPISELDRAMSEVARRL